MAILEFGSILFLCFFFPLFFFIYYLIKEKWRNLWLGISSIAFVILGRGPFVWYFLLITGITYFGLAKLNHLPKNISKKKMVMWIIFIEVLIWFIFIKGIKMNHLIIYPICYMTILLSNIGTLLDFSKNKKGKPNLFLYLLYVSCFSKLLFGPVLSYYEMEEELKKRTITREHIVEGCYLFLKGIFLNVLLVGMLSTLQTELLTIPISFVTSLVLLITAMLQVIIFMMSYSNMSIGLSKMLGFTFEEETSYPLCLSKMKYFFHAWHFSISKWWDEHLKIKFSFPIQICLFMILLSTCYGLNYVVALWFLFIGLGILIEELFLSKKRFSKRTLYIFHFIWMLLSFTLLVRPNIMETLRGFIEVPFWNAEIESVLSSYSFILMISLLVSLKVIKIITKKVKESAWYRIGRMMIYAFLMWITLVALVSGIDASIWMLRV